MAETTLASSSQKQVWINKYLLEYVRTSGFMPYMGKASNSIIRVYSELQEQGGKYINIPLITRLKGNGVTGSQVLEGFEEDLGNFNARVGIDWDRNAVVVPKSTSYLTEIDLWNAARDQLVTWSAEKLRDAIIQSLGQVVVPGANSGVYDTYVNYASASTAEKDAYLVANSDRILFGAAVVNAVSGVWATALATIDNTADKLTTAQASLAKRLARSAGAGAGIHIRPFMVPEYGREYYVMFCNPLCFRDLKADTAMIAANRDARAREGTGIDRNPLFQDGDLIYDGIIFREIPELDQLNIASTIQVGQNFLCGQSAAAVAWGQQPTPRTNTIRDYGFRPGTAIEELRGQNKLSFNGVQYGMVTVLSAAVAD